VRCRNREFYTRDDLTGVGGPEPRPATLQPREVQVNVSAGATGAPGTTGSTGST
jgi:hypothetical protein